MKKKILSCAASVILALFLVSPCLAAEVTHGKCVSFDKEKKTLAIEEYDLTKSKEAPYGKGTGKQATFKLNEDSLVGFPPEPGHIVRIAYQEKGGEKVIVRIQNISKQDLMKK